MSERHYQPKTILLCLQNLATFLGTHDQDISKLSEEVQSSIQLGFKFIEHFYYTEGTLPSAKPIYVYAVDVTATYMHAISFLRGEMAIQSVEDEYNAWEYGETDTPTFSLYPLAAIKANYPRRYANWVQMMIEPAERYLDDMYRGDDPYGLGDIDHYEASLFMRGE